MDKVLNFGLVCILLAGAACAIASIGSTFAATLNGMGKQWEAAQAQIALAEAESKRAEIARKERQAELALQARAQAVDAEGAARRVLWAGAGVGGLVVCVGLSFAAVAWAQRRAACVYPDARGQFPVIAKSGPGWQLYHDPNRQLGPSAAIRTPTALDALAGAVIATVRAIRNGSTPALPVAEPSAAFPLPGSEATMLQVASQAQVAQVRLAESAGRPKLIVTTGAPMSEHGGHSAAHDRGRLPAIRLVNDAAQIEQFERLLEAAND